MSTEQAHDDDRPLPKWAVLTDEDVAHIAAFASVTPEQIRGIEMLVILKSRTLADG